MGAATFQVAELSFAATSRWATAAAGPVELPTPVLACAHYSSLYVIGCEKAGNLLAIPVTQLARAD